MRTLVTFLGRTQRPDEGYPVVEYRFPDGGGERSAFVGYSLARRERPDRLVVMGTPGSIWDQLISELPAVEVDEDFRLALMEAVDEERVAPDLLERLQPILEEALAHPVALRLIPPALEQGEQVRLLTALAEVTEGSEQVSLDITHGYRHLPMLVTMAALYLREARPGLQVAHLWYAALDASQRTGSVHDLAGVLHIADWISALRRSELTGDYGEVARLIEDPKLAADLETGSFLESIHQGQQAKRRLQRVRQRLSDEPLSGAGALFQPILEARTEWVTHQRLYQRQRAHALNALERRDYLRSALYGFEAFVTKLVRRHAPFQSDPNRYEVRQSALDEYKANGPANPEWRAYKQLQDLRNVLAHGNRAYDAAVQSALASPDQMRQMLARCLDELLPEQEET